MTSISKCLCLKANCDGPFAIFYNLDQFNYFSRSYIKEAIDFGIAEVHKRVQTNSIIDIKLNVKGHDCYLIAVIQGISYVYIVTLEEAPHQHLINLAKHIIMTNSIKPTLEANFDLIKTDITIKNIKAELEETKAIIYDDFNKLLTRGEKLDDLIKKSDQLSETSKMFWDHSKKLNRCCIIL
jgi:hypothetical protein